jgi:hypothetical protein
MSAAEIWVAKDDGSGLIRATAIAGVARDAQGHISARLSGGDQAVVMLVADSTPDREATPPTFHLQLLRVITQLSDTAEASVVRPAHDEDRGWIWRAEPL